MLDYPFSIYCRVGPAQWWAWIHSQIYVMGDRGNPKCTYSGWANLEKWREMLQKSSQFLDPYTAIHVRIGMSGYLHIFLVGLLSAGDVDTAASGVGWLASTKGQITRTWHFTGCSLNSKPDKPGSNMFTVVAGAVLKSEKRRGGTLEWTTTTEHPVFDAVRCRWE